MRFTCEGYVESEMRRNGEAGSPASVVRKYTYVLPSGRKLKVVVDDDTEMVETAATTPCFMLRMEDDTD